MPPKKKAATVSKVNANASSSSQREEGLNSVCLFRSPAQSTPAVASAASSSSITAATTNTTNSAPQRLFIPRSFVQLYRKTAVGVALTESLDEMLALDKIDEPTALQVLAQFDRSMYFALKAKAHTNLLFDGHLEEYRLVDSVWTWVLTDATLKFDGRTVRSPRVKIVATKAYEQQE